MEDQEKDSGSVGADERGAIAKVDPLAPNKYDEPLDLHRLSITQLRLIGDSMAKSGMFPDIQKDAAKAMVKILAGQEIGVTPFQAMSNIHIIQGKAALGSNIMAAKLKGSGKYDYRADISNEKATVTIRERRNVYASATTEWEDIGSYTFSMDDARRIGLTGKDNWKNYPQNMLFARAISNAVRLYAPDVFSGAVYDPDELGGQTDGAGGVTLMPDDSQVKEAELAIAEATDEDQVAEIALALPDEIRGKVSAAVTKKLKELQKNGKAE